MAKLEEQKEKKPKGKKRKNPNPEHEDEVANKSIIIEAKQKVNDEIPAEVVTKKSKKRKNVEKDAATKEKRTKSQVSNDDGDVEMEHEELNEDGLHEPTQEELKESKKPENNLDIVTGRKKKKQKHQKLVEVQKSQSVEREKQRNEEYLLKWKNSRGEWKFEKLRQLSIQQMLFDEERLSADVWDIALEYLAGSKGAAKDKIVKLANDVIDVIDKQCETMDEAGESKQELFNSAKYQRARNLLQIFD